MGLRGILSLTHSSRRTNPARCSVQFLTERFSNPERGNDLPPFESLAPATPLYSGAVSFYGVEGSLSDLRILPLGELSRHDKIQHVVFRNPQELLVGFEQRIERWRLPSPVSPVQRIQVQQAERMQTYEHPHLAALHTVEVVDSGRRALVSCSASDSVLLIDLETGGAELSLRMPEQHYGRFYSLDADMDLRRHLIDDEFQRTHLNAAWPTDRRHEQGRILVSAFIQGALGVFDRRSGDYREITRGFVGCHGVRTDDRGQIYFTDSTSGHLIFLTRDGGIERRYAVDSRWLHDCVQLHGDLYAFALADRNELRLIDIRRDRVLWRRRFFTWPLEALFEVAKLWPGWLGNSTQALSFFKL